jgi:uncharacterized protein
MRKAPRKKKAAARARPRARSNPWLVIRSSGIHGRGAFARTDIPAGTRIIEYTGERVSNAEADRRYDDARMKRHHTFLFILNSRTVVDGAVGGNESRFINHSCDPNCESVIEGRHIWVDAIRDIPRGEELAYDYRYEFDDKYTVDDLAFYGCACGSPLCRGTIVIVPPRKRALLTALKRKHRRASGRASDARRHRQARTAR